MSLAAAVGMHVLLHDNLQNVVDFKWWRLTSTSESSKTLITPHSSVCCCFCRRFMSSYNLDDKCPKQSYDDCSDCSHPLITLDKTACESARGIDFRGCSKPPGSISKIQLRWHPDTRNSKAGIHRLVYEVYCIGVFQSTPSNSPPGYLSLRWKTSLDS